VAGVQAVLPRWQLSRRPFTRCALRPAGRPMRGRASRPQRGEESREGPSPGACPIQRGRSPWSAAPTCAQRSSLGDGLTAWRVSAALALVESGELRKVVVAVAPAAATRIVPLRPAWCCSSRLAAAPAG